MKISSFTNIYPTSKTLRFRLIPQGKTLENFENNELENDEFRADNFYEVKKLMDEYHKLFIEKSLNGFHLPNVKEYSVLHYKKEKTCYVVTFCQVLNKRIFVFE